MNDTHDFDRRMADYYGAEAPSRAPDWLLSQTLETIDTTKQRGTGLRGARLSLPDFGLRRASLAVVGAVAVVLVAVLAFNAYTDRPAVGQPVPSDDPRSAFLGTWSSTSDADGGTQTMTVRATQDGALEIVVTDDVASVCSRTPSTMTGTGRIEGSTQLVIPSPIYTCDDGSEAETLSGPPLHEQLRNLTYVHDPRTDVLTVGAGSVWRRPGAALPTLEPPIVDASQPWDPSRFPGIWDSTAADTGFLGTWESTDVDGSSLLLGIRVAEASSDTFEIVLNDDRAGGGRRRWPESDWSGPLCPKVGAAGPITMIGIGRIEGLALAIDSQTWLCTGDSGPYVVTGDRSIDLNQAYAPLVHDPETDTLVGPAGVVWHRRAPGSDPIAVPFWGLWPQSNLQDAQEAQRRADAGDPAFTWQLSPELATPMESVTVPVPIQDAADGAEILTRFRRDVLGWDRYMTVSRLDQAQGYYRLGWSFVWIRCGPGTNPLYPNDERGGDCPPTIGDTRYETVELHLMQPVRSGPTGIWVVTAWTELAPSDKPAMDLRYADMVSRQYLQAVPPTKDELMEGLETFLSARVAGEGADDYLTEAYGDSENRPTVPLLYATTKGDRFERFDIFDVQERPDWPGGDYGVGVRLFARGGLDVVEQQFQAWRGSRGQLTMDTMMTTSENGVEVPDPVVSGE